MISKELLSEVVNFKELLKFTPCKPYLYGNNLVFGNAYSYEYNETVDINIHELVFDKCIEWAWDQGYSITMFRANNIFHARVHGDDVEERRFYSNPDDKYDAVIQACEWLLKRRIK